MHESKKYCEENKKPGAKEIMWCDFIVMNKTKLLLVWIPGQWLLKVRGIEKINY